MKHVTLVIAVMAMVLAAAAQTAAAQEDEEVPIEEQLERREIELEIQRLEDEVEFDREERELDLEERRAEIDRIRGGHPGKKAHGFFILLIIITNILLTVWVFKDMNEKKIGRALWVPIVLLAGVFGAILYAIVRVADTRT